MKNSDLEKYVNKHRGDFDIKSPSDKVWTGIETALGKPTTYGWLWKAASIIFFLTTSFLLIDKFSESSHLDVASQKQQVSNDFGDVEKFYFQIISDKTDLIYDYDQIDSPIEVDFEQDLQKLDAMYEVLKEELKDNPSKQVIDALILNLLVRIDVLNQKIEELEGQENEQDEKSEDPSV